jgi:hypothetical protein
MDQLVRLIDIACDVQEDYQFSQTDVLSLADPFNSPEVFNLPGLLLSRKGSNEKAKA